LAGNSSAYYGGPADGIVPYSQISPADKSKIIWANGYSAPSALAEHEIIVSLETALTIYGEMTQNYIWVEDWESLPDTEKGAYLQETLGKTCYPRAHGNFGANSWMEKTAMKIVGVHASIDSISNPFLLISSDAFFEDVIDLDSNPIKYAVAPLTGNNNTDLNLIKFSYETNDGVRYALKNEVSSSLESLNSIVESMATAFLYIGIFFAVFASLMMMNFISTSISYKKREIGILRAVGARSSDVFGIFFNESLVIALINFALAVIAVFGFSMLLNSNFRNNYGLIITLFSFGLRQLILILVVSIGAAFIASVLPTTRISNKKPIDAINNN